MSEMEQVMAGLWDVFNKRSWLDGLKMKDRLKGYTPSEIHCIAYIGSSGEANVTKMADAFYMTRSAISKLTKKLMERGLVESYQRPDNKKEIYFRLTKQGQALNEIHEELHQEYRERDRYVFEQVTREQYESMLRFVELYDRHLEEEIRKTGVDLKSGGFNKL